MPLSHWLSFDAKAKTVALKLVASGDGNTLGAFNGYSRGQVVVKVPTGWHVRVHCVNTSQIANQSCAVTDGSLSTTPAFAGSSTPDPVTGLQPGRAATFTFLASRPGVFRIASLVDDEEVGNGMWDTLQVGGTKSPAVTLYLRTP